MGASDHLTVCRVEVAALVSDCATDPELLGLTLTSAMNLLGGIRTGAPGYGPQSTSSPLAHFD